MEGAEFEENLGLLLRWDQVRHLEARFENLGGNPPGVLYAQVGKARERTDAHLRVVMETVNTTLYDQFGQHRVDNSRGTRALGQLLNELGDPELILATTNYDRAAESALESLGFEVDAGFRAQPQRSPKLEPAGLIAERDNQIPVIHLHGAVGWYEHNGSVVEHHPDQPFNATLGTPVVLYPDPEKDPTSDATVSELWLEFNAGIESSDAILVVGHSLHDPALVRALNAASKEKPVVISYLGASGDEYVLNRVPDAIPIEIDFGPQIEAGKAAHRILTAFRDPEELRSIQSTFVTVKGKRQPLPR